MADYTQPAAVEQRVRFFDGQYLQDQDFADEQKYHLDRERRLSKALRVTGIVEGLTVTSAKANQVTVAPGTAIDSLGRQLVLSAQLTVQQRSVDLPDAKFKDKQGIKLYIVYQEDAVMPATTGIKGERRFQERPRLVAIAPDGQSSETTPWDNNTPAVLLTQFNLGAGGLVQWVQGTAQFAGMTLSGNLGIGTTPAFPLHVGAGKSVRLELGTSQKLSLGGNGTLEVDAPGVMGGRFQVSENGNVGIGTTSPGAKIGFVNVDATTEAIGLTWHNPSPTDYGIHRTAGAWTAPNYQQLRLGWTTGIVLDPGTAYGKSFVEIRGNGLRVTTGNVGINNADPKGDLDIGNFESRNRYLTLKVAGGNTQRAGLRLWAWQENYGFSMEYDERAATGNGLHFKTHNINADGVSQLFVGWSGNIGIGTTTPGAKLEVVGGGGVSVDFSVNGRMRSNNNDGGLWVSTDRFVGGNSTNQIGFWNGNAWRLSVNANGNVGIGTTAPLATLDVATGYMIMRRTANNGEASVLLNSLPNNALVFGGSWSQWAYFYWKDSNGTKFVGQVLGTPF